MAVVSSDSNEARSSGDGGPTQVAVIDIGSASIRMAVGEITGSGEVRTLENLSQAVTLGKDTFTTGRIDRGTTEDCVRVLRSYRHILDQYGIRDGEKIRVVATSAVREAENRLSFLDRVFTATGFDAEPIDEAEVNRVTFLGIHPLLGQEPLASTKAVVVEVGGGSTEVLLLQRGDVAFSHSYRLGSLRLRETLEAYRAPAAKVRQIMHSRIRRSVEQMRHDLSTGGSAEIIALGGDIRFAVSQILPDWDTSELARLQLADLHDFTDRMLGHSVDRLVQRYRLDFPAAETLGPALLAYVELVRSLDQDRLFVSNVNLRDGLLQEMALQDIWGDEFRNQIVQSAVNLGRKYDFDEKHAIHVASLAKQLFEQLQSEHDLSARYELLLFVAAILHEIGLFVGTSSYHKHTMYLILNSELFGLTRNDLLLVSLIARYHRRASPKPGHQGFSTLDRASRIAVVKLAGILRLAKALDESHSQRVKDIQCAVQDDQLVIGIDGVDDLSLEQIALRQSGSIIEDTFGIRPRLRRQTLDAR